MFTRVSSALIVALSLAGTAFGAGCAAQSGEDLGAAGGAETSGTAAHDFEGTIGNLKVLLRLDVQGSKATGSYFYADKTGNGDNLVLDGTVSGGKISLTEKVNGAGNATGTFEGTLSATGITGTWKNPGGSTKLPLSLKPITAKKIVTRKYAATAPKATGEYAQQCSLKAEVVEVFGLDAKVEKSIADALKVFALDKAADGTCDSDIREVTQSVALDASGFLTVHVANDSYGGETEIGSDYFNFNLATGKALGPREIFADGSEAKLKALVEAQINASKDLTAEEKKESITEFESTWTDETKLEDIAMGVGEKGITIDMWNNYEHANVPYAPVVEFPWSDIKPLLKTGSVVATLAQ